MERIPNNDLGYAIGRTARILYRLLDGNLRSLVLSFSQVNVLGYLAAKHARGEECTQKLIATECCSTRPSSVTGLLQALERQGYIERRAGEDARVKCVALTERGKEGRRRMQSLRPKDGGRHAPRAFGGGDADRLPLPSAYGG